MSLLEVKSGQNLGDVGPLFSKVETDDIEKYKNQLGPSEKNA